MSTLRTLALAPILALVGCPPPPTANEIPAPYATVPATQLDGAACANLRALQCPEGSPARGKCEDAFSKARTMKEKDTDDASRCVGAASSPAVVRTCGGPGTLTFSCPGK